MKNNGLIKYYRDYKDRYGRLKLDEIPEIEYKERLVTRYCTNKVVKYATPQKAYFGKYIPQPFKIDAEVLISQLYPKLGLKSAIYTPAVEYYWSMVMSNDLSTKPNFVNGIDFLRKMKIEQCKKKGIEAKEDSYPLCIPKSLENASFIKKFFTDRGLKSFIEMQVIDTAAANTDRNASNFFVQVNSEGKAEEVITFDHEYSGVSIGVNPDYRSHANFIGSARYKSYSECLFDIKQNETVASLVDMQELAEKIGSAPIAETAQDIKQTIGYQIDRHYVNALERSFETVAEDLIQ